MQTIPIIADTVGESQFLRELAREHPVAVVVQDYVDYGRRLVLLRVDDDPELRAYCGHALEGFRSRRRALEAVVVHPWRDTELVTRHADVALPSFLPSNRRTA